MNENIKLEVSSTGDLCSYPIASSSFTTSIVGNKIIIKSQNTLLTDLSNSIDVVREIELTDEEMAQILDVMADLAANKEKYEKNSGEMIFDAGYSVKGQLNGVSFDYPNNTELHNRLSEIINNIVEKRFPDIYVEMDEELNKLVEEKISKESDKFQLFKEEKKMNENIKLEVSSTGDLCSYPIASSSFTTSIVGNKIIIKSQNTLLTDLSNPVDVVREIELTDEEMAQILEVTADLAANKEKYEKNSGEMIFDAGYSVKGQLNGVSFDYPNNTELHNRLSEIINNIVEKRFPDIYVEMDEELNKLVEEKISKESDKIQFNGDNKVNDQAEISEPTDDINYIKKDEGKPAPIERLRKMYPTFFDENGELKEKAVELMDLLIQNYLKSNNNSLTEEETVGIKK